MRSLDDAARPPFREAWHAQACALAEVLVAAGRLPTDEWRTTFGGTLATALARGAPETEATYYAAMVDALEDLLGAHDALGDGELAGHVEAWREAYLRTPHGQPVERRPS